MKSVLQKSPKEFIVSIKRQPRKFYLYLKTLYTKEITLLINSFFPFVKKQNIDSYTDYLVCEISKSTNIVSPLKTLEKIQKSISNKKRGAYMRFGDGDAFLAVGINDLFQKSSNLLSDEMKEAFSLKGEFVLKSLSIHSILYGYEREMYNDNHLVSDEYANKLLSYTFTYFVGHKIYSPISLHFAASYYSSIANTFLKLLKSKTVLFIGNETTPLDKVELLFGAVPHIKTPPKNSYDKINDIEEDAIRVLDNLSEFGVVVVAMGCSGRILMKRLYKRNYNVFLFDFGSLLDGICGNESRPWLKEISNNYEFLQDL